MNTKNFYEHLELLHREEDMNYEMPMLDTFRKQINKDGNGSTKDFQSHINLLTRDKKVKKYLLKNNNKIMIAGLVIALLAQYISYKYYLTPRAIEYKFFKTHSEINDCTKKCIENNDSNYDFDDYINYNNNKWLFDFITSFK